MKNFKKMDAWISVILIAAFTILPWIKNLNLFLAGYLVVGGWQLISMIIHAIDGRFAKRDSQRYWYHWTVAITGLAVISGFIFQPLLLLILYALLFVSPFMAVFYTWLCFKEVKKMNQRPLALLR